MWWMLGQGFFSLPIVRALRTSRGRGDSGHSARVLCLVTALTHSAGDRAWADAAELAEDTKTPLKEAERVWTVCVEEGILRDALHGKNARAWMVENGMIREAGSRRAPAAERQPVEGLASTTKNFFV